MTRTRIKICGFTRVEDGLAAAQAGADAIGLVFYPPSPRYVEPLQAAAIVRALPPFVSVVGLFVNADPQEIGEIMQQVPLDLLQFHGQECPDYCAGFTKPWIKALSMRPGLDLLAEARRYEHGRGLLLDAYRPGVPGGTGETFDWSLIPAELAPRIVLAGGLDAGNVGEAIRQVRPYAVDVSGGIERQKGIKDHAKIAAFTEAVRCMDALANHLNEKIP
jgi:phosphoribosylanthranilate isomerase